MITKLTSRPLFLSLAVALAAVGCGGVRAQTLPEVKLPADVAEGGQTVYFGSVFPLDQKDGLSPVYVYERRVNQRVGGVAVSSHITRDASSGAVVMADTASHTTDYRLIDYTLHANQLGQTGSIRVEKDQVTFRVVDAKGERETVEKTRDPVVVGPTLVGHMFVNLPSLRSGQVLPVRMAVLDRLETIGFELQAVAAPAGQTRVRMKPSSFLLAAVIDPITFTFDTATGKLLHLEGRVPPRIRKGDKLNDLDARVEYRYITAAYR
jgi:hypothetical protein